MYTYICLSVHARVSMVYKVKQVTPARLDRDLHQAEQGETSPSHLVVIVVTVVIVVIVAIVAICVSVLVEVALLVGPDCALLLQFAWLFPWRAVHLPPLHLHEVPHQLW
eukprot:m.190123 g.190123  ORF g.190123 m.190123 type:complete len:109 (-) comp14807_c0_seq7:3674-4000(-)